MRTRGECDVRLVGQLGGCDVVALPPTAPRPHPLSLLLFLKHLCPQRDSVVDHTKRCVARPPSDRFPLPCRLMTCEHRRLRVMARRWSRLRARCESPTRGSVHRNVQQRPVQPRPPARMGSLYDTSDSRDVCGGSVRAAVRSLISVSTCVSVSLAGVCVWKEAGGLNLSFSISSPPGGNPHGRSAPAPSVIR